MVIENSYLKFVKKFVIFEPDAVEKIKKHQKKYNLPNFDTALDSYIKNSEVKND